jgi:hypothetical protein
MLNKKRPKNLLFISFIIGILILPVLTFADADKIFKENSKAVVVVVTYNEKGEPISQGSGFIVREDGAIVTNYHVISNAKDIKVKAGDKVLDVEGLILADKENDLVILKAKGEKLPVVKLGDIEKVNTGEKVYVISSPQGLENTISDGILSGIREITPDKKMLQITAPISPGSSGGPVFNKDGEVIGVVTFLLEEAQNLNFAMPVNVVKDKILLQIITPLKKIKFYEYTDKYYKMVIKPKFTQAWPFSEGIARVNDGEKWGYIDKTGKYVINPQFDFVENFSEGLAFVEVSNRIGYIDKTGKYIINPQFEFDSGHELLNWVFVGSSADNHKSKYDFSEGLAVVGDGDKLGYINKKGSYVIKPQFSDSAPFSNGYARVKIYINKYRGSREWNYIDKTGKFVINPQSKEQGNFFEGLARRKVDKKWGYIDKTGKYVIKPQFDFVENFSEGLAVAQVGDRFGYIDKTGTYVINPQFDNAGNFSEGLAVAQVGDRFGYIDKTGTYVINPQFDNAGSFSEGLAAVKVNGKWGYIKK